MWHAITTNLLWSQGFNLVIGIIVVALLSYLIYRPFYYLTICFFLFSLWTFRNPSRTCPELQYDKRVLVCPADGKIMEIQHHDVGYGFAQKVSICLSLFDAHVMWLPCAGVISDMIYSPGAFMFACLPKNSELNEHHDVYVTTSDGKTIMIRQIAGIFARRICWWVQQGQRVQAGDTFGMIRFGSRVELFLPKEVSLTVGTGQQVFGGQTVIGHWTHL